MDDDCLLTWLFPSEGPADENTFHYGPLTLSMASRQGKAITLLADQVFNPALVFAEQIDLGIIQVADKTSMASTVSALTLYVVCELEAGTGLPGLYAFTKGAKKVVLTDYPDNNILGCLWDREISLSRISKIKRPSKMFAGVRLLDMTGEQTYRI
jgi:hypothetical protein